MIFKKAVLGSFFASMFSMVAFGGWSSGGGELFKDQNNPWFVKNTSAVNFCVEIDEANFGLSRAEAEYQLKQALVFWKKNMAAAKGENTVGIAKQNFVIGECSNTTDLRVQFGVLTQPQQDYFKTPQKFVSSIVRTSYDTVNLKGKGFLYVSPQFGPLRMQSGRDSVEQPWSMNHGNILGFVLAHELGHMFGYTHSMASLIFLMAEEFPEMSVDRWLAPEISQYNIGNIPNVFEFEGVSKIECGRNGLNQNMRNYYDLPNAANCVEFSANSNQIEVFWATSKEGLENRNLAGQAIYSGGVGYKFTNQSMYLPAEQVVFKENTLYTRIPLPTPYDFEAKAAVYQSLNGIKRPIYVQLMKGDFDMSGEFGGKMILDVTKERYFDGTTENISQIKSSFQSPEKKSNGIKNAAENFLKSLKNK